MAERVRVAISGATGRMGQALARLAAEDGVEVVGGIGRLAGGPEPAFPVVEQSSAAADLLQRSDVVVDFSSPGLLRALLDEHGERLAGKALVVGTTGLSDADRERLAAQASRTAVLVAANFSVGVNLLLSLAEQAARALGEEFDVEIVEAHHRRKVDAPSGTALVLGEAVARGRAVELGSVRRDGRSGETGERPRGEIGFHSLRGGDVVGEHRVQLIGERERVELAHVATDRELFAAGALRAARWMRGRPAGEYSMRDVLDLT